MSFQKLQSASFRGFQFLTPSGSLNEGRKTVTHEYVNSDKRFVEDLGPSLPKFSLKIIISGADAMERRDRFRAILKQPGAGLLIHPHYGEHTVTVEGSYSIDGGDQSLGVYEFNVAFAVASEGGVFPRETASKALNVYKLDESTRGAAFVALENLWSVPETPQAQTDALNKIDELTSALSRASKVIQGDLSSYNLAVDTLSETAPSAVRSGSTLAGSIADIFAAVSDVEAQGFDIYRAMFSLFGFGLADIPFRNQFGLSRDQRRRQSNRDIFNSTIRAAALSSAYSGAIEADYLSTRRLSETRQSLDQEAVRVISKLREASASFDASNNAGIAANPNNVAPIIQSLQALRADAARAFDEKEAVTFRETTIRLEYSSARLLSYSLYDGESLSNSLGELNIESRPSFFTGQLNALER